MRTGSIALTIDSEFRNVFLVGLAVQSICASIPLSEQSAYEMEMAVVEAVNNSIEQSCHNRAGHPITICMHLTVDRITFVIADDGDTIMSLHAAPALEDSDTATMPPRERGRGVQIIRALMDEVAYRTEGTSNILTMVKYLPVA